MTEPLPPALRLRGLGHSYGRTRALDDVSLQVGPGEFHALLGVNGAGKSTLFALVTGLLAPAEGRIELDGRDMAAEGPKALARIGVVFQSRALDADLSVRQNLIYHAALHGIGRREAAERIAAVLEQVGLTGLEGRRIASLSGGQARRAEIARALIHRPSLMLLDEATVGLDVKSRAEVLALTRHAIARHGAAALWATHLLDEIEPDDGLTILHRGRVLWQGVARDFAPRAELSGAFLDLTGQAA